MNMTELSEGQSAVVTGVRGTVALRRRMMEMGLLRNTRIHVERYAPLMDPIQIRVRGTSLALRCSEAAFIDVKIEDGPR